MAELTNDFSWSFSRQQAFDSCRRRYYYRYYAFWGGWAEEAPLEARKAYLFSKMQTLPMLIGTAVHQTVEHLLKSHRRGHDLPRPVEFLRGRLNQAWIDSKHERWRSEGPKRCPPLYEHYYQVDIDPAQLTRLRELAIACVENFVTSDLYRSIRDAGVDHWRAIEGLETLEVGPDRVFVSPDFAFDRGDETWILDWKTGEPRADQEEQLLCYALFARDRWSLPASQLRAFDVFLPSLVCKEVKVDETRLAATRTHLDARIQEMKAVLRDPENNRAAVEDFPGTDQPFECRRCFFREICDVRLDAAEKSREQAA